MQYDIYFHGELAEGVSQQEAVEVLQKITGLTPAKIEAHFFAGKSVRIKRNLSHEQAKDFSARLAQAGLITEIRALEAEATAAPTEAVVTPKSESESEAEAEAAPETQASSQQPETIPPATPKKRNPLVYGAAICLAVIVAIGAGLWFYSQSLLDYSVPQQVKTAEAVLLNDNTIAIGHANIDKLVEIEQLVKGFNSEEILPDPDADGLLGKLLNAGVDLRQSLHQVVFSLAMDQTEGKAKAYLNNILIGDFNQQQILAFLQQHYEVTNRSHNGKTYYEFTQQIRETCEYTPSQALAFGQGFIVISKDKKVLELVDAINNPPANLTQTNSEWIKYRNDHLVSVGVLQPEHLDKYDSLGAVLFFSGLRSALPSVDGIFMGLAGTAIPPKAVIDATVISQDQQWLTTSEASLNAGLLAAKQNNQSSELFSAIINNLDIKRESENLNLAFSIDNQLTDQIKQTVEEGLGSLFSMSSSNSKSEIPPEKLEENPKTYQSITPASLAKLPAFENTYNQTIHWQQGPVAIRITELHHSVDDIQEISLEAVTSGIPNTASSSFASASQLHIDDITNANGESLMDPATCGKYINSDPVVLTDSFGKGELKASKKIRLKPGAKIADIASIKGRVSLNIATQIETQRFTAPINQAIVKTQGAYLRIKEIAGNNISYLVSGAKQPLLNVRGLNAKGQYLSGSGSSSFGAIGSGPRSHNASYQGQVSAVEVTYATQRQAQEYTFNITDLSPPSNTNSFSPEHKPPVAYDMADWKQVVQLSQKNYPQDQFNSWLGQPVANTRSGPIQTYLFKPELQRFGPERRFNSHMVVNLPFIRSLLKASGRLNLTTHSLTFDNGEQIKPTGTPWVSPITLDYKGGWNLSLSDEAMREEGYLAGSVDIKYLLDDVTYEKVKDTKLVSLNGDLNLALPTQIKATSIPALQLGENTKLSGFDLQLIKLDGNRQTYSINGDESALVAIYALNSEGKEIGKLDPFGDEFGVPSDQTKRRVAGMWAQGEIDQLIVYEVTEAVMKRLPLTLDIN
ncbi:hypothetical protein [Maricurvus nonylphenolicus]|uniref:hypothetical protein n=1 Tax=Maricurvus nonylphenolicus TaxID=1008307 RepID=UPI0036F3CF7D